MSQVLTQTGMRFVLEARSLQLVKLIATNVASYPLPMRECMPRRFLRQTAASEKVVLSEETASDLNSAEVSRSNNRTKCTGTNLMLSYCYIQARAPPRQNRQHR